jgi:hypothetical protein
MFRCFAMLAVFALADTVLADDDLKTGPEPGALPELKVFDTTGPNTGSEIDYVADRKGKPTVYVFIAADKWDRPVARFLKTLDAEIAKASDDAYLVAVWLADDAAKTKEYLPRAQQSIKLERTALTCFQGDKAGPKNWNIHPDAHVTAVVSSDGKAVKSFGFRSINETDVPAVKEALAQAIKK